MQVSKFKNLPKIELHLHIDCSLSYDVVKKIDPSEKSETSFSKRNNPCKKRGIYLQDHEPN